MRHIAPFGVRMPPELKARIEDAASKSGRSLNAEIVHRLEGSFAPNPASDLSSISSGQLLDELLARFGSSIQIQISQNVIDQAKVSPKNGNG